MKITIPSNPPASFTVPLVPPEGAVLLENLTVWTSTGVKGYLCSPPESAVQLAISNFIGRPALLICKGPGVRTAGGRNFVRDLELDVDYPSGNPANVHYADGFPFLFTTEASLSDLREKIRHGDRVNGWDAERWSNEGAGLFQMSRFRPNVVIENQIPWEEDGFAEVEIGGKGFLIASRCNR